MTSEQQLHKFHTLLTDDIHYPDLGGTSVIGHVRKEICPNQIRSTTQIWVVTRHEYGISALVSQMSFWGKASGGDTKCQLFAQATRYPVV